MIIPGVVAAFRSSIQVVVPSCDPYWCNTVLALSMDGTEGSELFIEKTGRAVENIFGNSPIITTSVGGLGGSCGRGLGDGLFMYEILPSPFTTAYTVEVRYMPDGSNNGPFLQFGNIKLTRINNVLELQYIGGAGQTNRTIGTINEAAFTHIEVSVVGTTAYVFLNGILSLTTNVEYSYYGDHPYIFGSDEGPVACYLDELIITRNIAKHTTSFTPSTSQFVACEGNTNSVLVAMHLNGTEGSTTYTDLVCTNVMTVSPGASIVTTEGRYGSCLKLDPGENLEISIFPNIYVATIEFLFKHIGTRCFFSMAGDGLYYDNGLLTYRNAGSFVFNTIASGLDDTNDIHLAIVFNQFGTITFFVNGVGSEFFTEPYNSPLRSINLGGGAFFGSSGGYFSELLVTGTEKYTTDFTPPAGPFSI